MLHVIVTKLISFLLKNSIISHILETDQYFIFLSFI